MLLMCYSLGSRLQQYENLHVLQVEAMDLDGMASNLPERLEELGVRYDPVKLEAMFAHRKGELNRRAVRVAGSLGLFISAVVSDWALGKLHQNYKKRGKELAQLLSNLGPSFVKVFFPLLSCVGLL
jgi:hypothetical protein